MLRSLLLLAVLVAGASCFVYTCNEVKQLLNSGHEFHGSKACAVLPASVPFPFNDEPYTWYMYNTYIEDSDSGMSYELSGLEENTRLCMGGLGPWFLKSDNPAQFVCSSAAHKYAEIIFLFTSDEPHIVQASIGGSTATYGKGTHVFVAPEGSLLIQKVAIDDGKETTLKFYSGAGANEAEERFELMPEKFIAGSTTVIIGPVTTIIIEDDVTVTLTVSSFDEKLDIPAVPGASFSLMSTGRANDLQSSRPSISVSTRYDINDDTFQYDAISVTGTVLMDENVGTAIGIDCSNIVTGRQTFPDITTTSDVSINAECTALEITYKGSIAADDIDRSSEVIYLRVDSNSDPVMRTTTPGPDASPKTPADTTDPVVITASPDPDATPKPPVETTRRTPPPTTTHARPTMYVSTSPVPSSTKKAPSTTSAASGVSIVIAAVFALLRVL